MPTDLKRHLITAGDTFISTFVLLLLTMIAEGQTPINEIFTVPVIGGVMMSAVVATAKVLREILTGRLITKQDSTVSE